MEIKCTNACGFTSAYACVCMCVCPKLNTFYSTL